MAYIRDPVQEKTSINTATLNKTGYGRMYSNGFELGI